MRVLSNKEMRELEKIFEPYEEGKGFKLISSAPEEAVEAFKKYREIWHRLIKEEEEALLLDQFPELGQSKD